MPHDLSRLGSHDHACLIYREAEEKSAVVAAFLRGALANRERYTHVLHGTTREAFLAGMRAHGVDAEAAIASGDLVLLGSREAYLASGAFDADAMLRFMAENDRASLDAGYRGSRATGEMEWWLAGVPSMEDAERYEAALNEILPGMRTHGICLFDERTFPTELLPAVLRTHAKVLYRGRVCENPFYEPPGAPEPTEGTAGAVQRELRVMLRMQEMQDALDLCAELADPEGRRPGNGP